MSVIGVLTAGGDCPGLNAVIRGVVARGVERGHEVVGVLDGWEGLMRDRTMPLDRDAALNVAHVLTDGVTAAEVSVRERGGSHSLVRRQAFCWASGTSTR